MPSPTTSTSRDRAADAGYVLALFALLLLPLMIVVGFAVDLGFWYTQATREQRAADAAALAGVVWLPDIAKATAVALDTAERNGFDDADPDIAVVVSRPAGGQRLQVRIDDSASLFFSSVVLGDFDIARQAIAEYTKPVPMGSPHNYLGTGNILPAPARENLWLSVSGYCARREHGDRITPRADAEDTPAEDGESAANFQSCQPGAPASVRSNPEYSADGYFYAIEMPANVSGTRNVDVWDAADCSGGSEGDSNSGGPGYTYTMRSNDSLDPLQTTVLGSTNVTPANCATYNSQWVTMFTLNNPTAGIYYLQIKPIIPVSKTRIDGQNQLSLRVVNPAWGSSWPCTFDAAFAVSNAPHRTDCPKVYGTTHMGVYASFSNLTPEFFLASIGPEHATKRAQIELFDTAEGAQQIEILNPNGAAIPFTWEIACQDGTYRSENGGTCTTGENPPVAPGYGPVANVTFMNVSGSAPYANRPWGGRESQSGRYSDRLIRLSFDLPSAATEPTWFSGRTWYKIRYTTGGSTGDRTTWSIRIVGDPVHLVE